MKLPEASPVNGRPVRLEPCAPGARPSTTTRALGSPKPGTGLPQYSQSWYARRFSRATCSRYATRRGQRVQDTISSFKILSQWAVIDSLAVTINLHGAWHLLCGENSFQFSVLSSQF